MQTTAEIVAALEMTEHPEGGWFRETYRSPLLVAGGGLPDIFDGPRNMATSIYFLLEGQQVSKLHRIKSDELWFFHGGAACTVHILSPKGDYTEITLGMDLANGQRPQCMVPAESWFGAEVLGQKGHTLVGCVVAPGFDFRDWELANREPMIRAWPGHSNWISRLT